MNEQNALILAEGQLAKAKYDYELAMGIARHGGGCPNHHAQLPRLKRQYQLAEAKVRNLRESADKAVVVRNRNRKSSQLHSVHKALGSGKAKPIIKCSSVRSK